MATILRMPAVSANATHATLVNWNKQEGDSVLMGESLAEIETEKAIIELNAELDGILGKLLVRNGAEVEVGAAIAMILAAGETDVDADPVSANAGTGAGTDATPSSAARASGTAVAAHAQTRTSPVPQTGITLPAPSRATALNQVRRIVSSPVGRLLAKQHGIDLARVRGSGPNGRVIKQDVQRFIEAGAHSAHTAPSPIEPDMNVSTAGDSVDDATGWTDLPHTNMRRTIARRLTESKSTVPHFYLSIDCRMDRLMTLRAEINAVPEQNISINTFVLRATALALRDVPGVNVAWTETTLRRFHSVDIAVAVSTDSGLITPILRDAANMSLAAIGTEMSRLAERARNKQLHADEFLGGSFSVSNLGMHGVDDFAAIINPPQAGILAVGAIRAQPVVQDGQIVVGHVMRCILSVDHRAVDGALAATWCGAFRRLLETPLTMLI